MHLKQDAHLKTQLTWSRTRTLKRNLLKPGLNFCMYVLHFQVPVCLFSSLILHDRNKPWFHPVFNTVVSLLCYECICRRKLPGSGSKRTSLHVTACAGWKCTIQGQNATAPFGTNVSVQSGLFRVRMPVLCISSNFQCHNVTIQGRKCTILIKCNDAFWHKRWVFTRGQNHPSSVLARTTIEWKVLIGSFDYPTLLTLRQRLVQLWDGRTLLRFRGPPAPARRHHHRRAPPSQLSRVPAVPNDSNTWRSLLRQTAVCSLVQLRQCVVLYNTAGLSSCPLPVHCTGDFTCRSLQTRCMS